MKNGTIENDRRTKRKIRRSVGRWALIKRKSCVPIKAKSFRTTCSFVCVCVCVGIRLPLFPVPAEITVDGAHEEGNGNGNANAAGSRKYLSKGAPQLRQRRTSPGNISGSYVFIPCHFLRPSCKIDAWWITMKGCPVFEFQQRSL